MSPEPLFAVVELDRGLPLLGEVFVRAENAEDRRLRPGAGPCFVRSQIVRPSVNVIGSSMSIFGVFDSMTRRSSAT